MLKVRVNESVRKLEREIERDFFYFLKVHLGDSRERERERERERQRDREREGERKREREEKIKRKKENLV